MVILSLLTWYHFLVLGRFLHPFTNNRVLLMFYHLLNTSTKLVFFHLIISKIVFPLTCKYEGTITNPGVTTGYHLALHHTSAFLIAVVLLTPNCAFLHKHNISFTAVLSVSPDHALFYSKNKTLDESLA